MKFKTKECVIEATSWRGDWSPLVSWLTEVSGRGMLFGPGEEPPLFIDSKSGKLIANTLNGPVEVEVGDWIIQGVEGDFYPCKPTTFVTKYEPVDEVNGPTENPIWGLSHPAAPHVASMLAARSALTIIRDGNGGDDDKAEAENAIRMIDEALEWLGYKHFSQGGMRAEDNLQDVIALHNELAKSKREMGL